MFILFLLLNLGLNLLVKHGDLGRFLVADYVSRKLIQWHYLVELCTSHGHSISLEPDIYVETDRRDVLEWLCDHMAEILQVLVSVMDVASISECLCFMS